MKYSSVLIGRGVHRIVTTIKNTQITEIHQAQGINFPNDVLQGLKNRLLFFGCR
jgi:hypothetical protein